MIRYGKSPWGPLMHVEPTKEQLAREAEAIPLTPVNTAVNTKAPTSQVLTPDESSAPSKDRHKPGYMADYMRKRRAK